MTQQHYDVESQRVWILTQRAHPLRAVAAVLVLLLMIGLLVWLKYKLSW